MRKDCVKHKKWFQKKGNFLSFVCFETNLVDVPSNTWWLDSGAIIHISINMQGYLTTRQPMTREKTILMGSKMGVKVEDIGTYI